MAQPQYKSDLQVITDAVRPMLPNEDVFKTERTPKVAFVVLMDGKYMSMLNRGNFTLSDAVDVLTALYKVVIDNLFQKKTPAPKVAS